MLTTSELIERIPGLAVNPESLTTLLEVLDDPTVGADRLVPIVEMDPGLTAGILRTCNSSYFSWSREIGTVREALVRIGNLTFARLAFVICLEPVFRTDMSGYRMETNTLWRHSLAVAYGASRLVAALGAAHLRERAFTAGILHDIGKLALDEALLEHRIQDPGMRVETIDRMLERHVAGLDHAEIGGVMLEEWHLPREVVEAVRSHHVPDHAGKNMELSRAVHAADVVLQTVEGRLSETGTALARSRVLEWGVPEELLDDLHETIEQAGDDMMSVILARRR